MSYRVKFPKEAPRWMAGTWGTKFWRQVGQQFDDVADRARAGVLARFPQSGPVDALTTIGRDRTIERNPAESDQQYRDRLQDAWETFETAGGRLGLLRALNSSGFPTGSSGCTIVTQNGKYFQLDGSLNLVSGDLMACINRPDLTGALSSPKGWMFNAVDNVWSFFGIVIPVPYSMGLANIGRFNRIIKQFRPGMTLYVGCWVIQAGETLGWPAGTLGSGTLGSCQIDFIEPYDGGHTRIGYTPEVS